MIRQEGRVFCLETANTDYVFAVNEAGIPEHLYYGPRINLSGGVRALMSGKRYVEANSVRYDEQYPRLGLETARLEAGTPGKGDIREPFAEVLFADGSSSLDFRFVLAEISRGKYRLEGLPCACGKEEEAESLTVVLRDRDSELYLELLYGVFADCDAITRSARLINRTGGTVRVKRLMSAQLDFACQEAVFTTFHGAWGREMNRTDRPCGPGILASGSAMGVSGSRSNPFCMISGTGATEEYGWCIGSNLVYSGNHLELCEGDAYGGLRFLTGIHPRGFDWSLAPGETFTAPEAVTVFSAEGRGGMSRAMHRFVRRHIVRGVWRDRPRPILINSWESVYYGFNEESLLGLARTAADLGVELFVLDDGWFGRRDDDTSSLGDWTEDRRKLPGGLSGLADRLSAMGLRFGLWVEPEMVSGDSDLYRAHPDWAVRHPERGHSLGRGQMILNLARPEVTEYLYRALETVFSSAKISYVKWDMNRIFSDVFGQGMEAERQTELLHRYYLGLYGLLERLTARFPEILFEGCASGGGRFDLGILCYMPQIWTRDNTDAQCRTVIQNGVSFGYPMNTVSAHVSASPNHQTGRISTLYSRFAAAAFGVLGYECDVGRMSREEREEIRLQIAAYRLWRAEMQAGEFYRLPAPSGKTRWMIVSRDREKGWLFDYHTLAQANPGEETVFARGLDRDAVYRTRVWIPGEEADGAPWELTASGGLFCLAGFKPAPEFGGMRDPKCGPDFACRIYLFERISPRESGGQGKETS